MSGILLLALEVGHETTLGTGDNLHQFHPSDPQLLRIAEVLWMISGVVRYSHWVIGGIRSGSDGVVSRTIDSMSAQNSPRRGVFAGIAGLLGFSVLSGLLVTVMVAPALAVTGITASSTISMLDSLPEYIQIGQQPERNTIYATYTGSGNTGGYYPIATIYDQNRQEVRSTRSRRTPWMLPSTARTGASSTTVAWMSRR